MKKSICVFIGILCVLIQVQASGTEDPNNQQDYFSMSLEELMEVPVVVSSSRQASEITKSSAPISIVSSEDIHYGGQTNIGQMLQFVPGTDVVKLNRYYYGVGVHGLHESISNRVVSLVDGRNANNPLFGGAEYNRLPLFPEDIERIEVVRGPGGAVWGANAYSGVVNIITKEPEDTLGFFGSTTVTEFGDTFTHLRWGAAKGDWAWRFSGGYEDLNDSDEAGAGKFSSYYDSTTRSLIGYDGFIANDFSRTWKFDTKAVYRPSEDIKISVGAGYSHLITGNYEMSGYYPIGENNRSEMIRTFMKIEREFDDGSSGYLQWFGNFLNMNYTNIGYHDIKEYDVETQYNFAPMAGHHLSVGGNFRWDDSTLYGVTSSAGEYYRYPHAPYHERWAGLFAIDRWDVTDRWTLEAQVRGDWYSEVSEDWSSRFSALYDLDGTDRHILRFSAARAYRAPLVSIRDLESKTVSVFGMYYGINNEIPDDLHNERIWSYEIGYSGQFTDNVSLNINTFYHRYSDMLGYRPTTGPTPGNYYVTDNIDGADSYGGEVELAYKDENMRLSVWHAYEHFVLDQRNQPIRSFQPPKFKSGVNARLFLDNGWIFNANYRFNDETPANPGVPAATIGDYHLLDLALSKRIANNRGELMIGVSDVFNKTNDAVLETAVGANHTTPGRMFFGRVQFHF